LLLAQELCLLWGGFFESARGQAAGRGLGDLLHLGQINIQPWPLLPEGTANDDFAPVLGDFGDAG